MSAEQTQRPANSNPAPIRWGVYGWLAVILLVAFALRAARLAELPGGFLVFNEGFYIDAGLKNLAAGGASWLINPIPYDKPPLYEGVVTGLYALHLPLVASARLVSVLSGVATVLFTFMLARLLFDERTGLVAAAALAAMPGVVLVDHNIQVDPLSVMFTTLGVLAYVWAARSGRTRDALLGGVALGLGILTKQPAALALPALLVWDVWRTHDWRQLLGRRVWVFAVTALAVGSSWYLLQLAIASQKLLSGFAATGDRADMTTVNGAFFWLTLRELAWMQFPVAALVAIAGIGLGVWQRKAGDKLILVFLGVGLLYYLRYHLHPYYLLPISPFLAMAIGRACIGGIDRLGARRWVGPVVAVALIASMALGSVMLLSGQKWGRWSPTTLRPPASAQPGRPWLYVDTALNGFFGPTTDIVDRAVPSVPIDVFDYADLPATQTAGSVVLSLPLVNTDGTVVKPVTSEPETWIRPVFFGYALGQRDIDPSSTSVYVNSAWTVQRVGPLWRFGFDSRTVPSRYYLYDRTTLAAGPPPQP